MAQVLSPLTGIGAKKATQTLSAQSFSRSLGVMDVRAENRGRPHQKMRFSGAPMMGRNFLTQSGVAPANQTKKGQFMNFSQARSGTKVQFVNRACFPKEKHPNSQKWAKFMNFAFWPFFWFGLQGRLLTQGHPGARVRNVRGKFGRKNLCLCCLSSLKESATAVWQYPQRRLYPFDRKLLT